MAHEMDDRAHKELLDVLISHKGPVLLSGYDNDLYNDRLAGWHREETISITQARKKATEVLRMNFEPEWHQMRLDI